MPKYLAYAVVFLAAAIACGGCGSPQDDLVGTWVIDHDALLDSMKDAPSVSRELAKSMVESAKMELVFTEDTMKMNVDMMGKKESKEAKYTVEEVNGDELVLKSKDENGTESTVRVRLDGDTLEVNFNDQTVKLRRKE